MATRSRVLACALLAAWPSSPAALDNGLGLTPAMGWSSWNFWGGRVNEAVLMSAADAFVAQGLRDAGYVYINLDDGWAVRRNSSGYLEEDRSKFPRGLPFVVDYVHSKGMKFGIYTARGSTTCMGRPGSDSHEAQDAKLWAAWGVDFLKEDSCGGTTHGTVWEQYARMRDALNATGRSIFFSVTQRVPYRDAHPKMHCYGDNVFTTFTWLEQGLDPTTLANSYLVEYCNNMDFFGFTGGVPRPGGFLSNLDSQALLTFDNLTTKGAYNDADMLEVCNGGLTFTENRAQFATWAILSSPLILGNDVTAMDDDCKRIVLNPEVIAVSQDPLVSRGKLVWQWPDATWPNTSHAGAGGKQAAPEPRFAAAAAAAAADPAPPVVQLAVLAKCGGNQTAKQQFGFNASSGLLRLAGTSQCLTYGGYREANFGLAECTGWSRPGIGGQTWHLSGGSIYNIGNGDKCVDVYNCDAARDSSGASPPLQVCSCSDGGQVDCYDSAHPAKCGGNNLKWSFFPQGSAAAPIRSALDDSLCVTAAPAPSSGVNITLQAWRKPLHDGSVALVVFNRGYANASATVPWAWLGVPAGTALRVRDLHAREDLGVSSGPLAVDVGAHDARALRFYTASQRPSKPPHGGVGGGVGVDVVSAAKARRGSGGVAASGGPNEPLPDFCRNLSSAAFKLWHGNGSGVVVRNPAGGCDGVDMASAAGMAAAFQTPTFDVVPRGVYNVTWRVKTTALRAVSAYFTGGVYVQFFDSRVSATYGDGWFPGFGPQEAEDTGGWAERRLTFTVPSTAVRATLQLAFAAHTTAYEPDRMHGGMATGRVQIRDVAVADTGVRVPPPEPSVSIPTPNVTKALQMVSSCFVDASLTGNFTVGSDYIISGNLSPDLGMGLFGVRRMGTAQQMALYERQWVFEAVGGDPATGEIRQRVMAQSWWPLGVDNIFSFTGNVTWLRSQLPAVDIALAFVATRADPADGLFHCQREPSKGSEGSSCGGPGMDWVDWYTTRASGKTFMFELWHAWTLDRVASLHEEFASSFGNATRAASYRARASRVRASLAAAYWAVDHWTTNHPSLFKDEGVWYDDQVWSLYFGLNAPGQEAALWRMLSATPPGTGCRGKGGATTCAPEGVPTRWSNLSSSGRHAETWFGRLGAGDILARFASGQAERARGLLERISAVFVGSGNVYESYDMAGGVGTDPGSNYLEHCAGYAWAVTEGVFGVSFVSDANASATVHDPSTRVDPAWPTASARFVLRGTSVLLDVAPAKRRLTMAGDGPTQRVRFVPDGGDATVVSVGTAHPPFSHSW